MGVERAKERGVGVEAAGKADTRVERVLQTRRYEHASVQKIKSPFQVVN